MAAKNLAKDIIKYVLDNPSKTIDMSLLKNKIVYATPKYYSEEQILFSMTPARVRSVLKKVRKSILDDFKHLKSIAVLSTDSLSNLDVISALGFLIDSDEFFQTIEAYIFDDKMGLSNAIYEAMSDRESDAEQYQKPHDPMFFLLLMEQFTYLEDRLCSHARRFLFQEFSRSIDSDRIVITQTFFKEIFYDFNSHIKGLIYQEESDDSSIAHFSIHFQIPIIQSPIETKGRKKICILCKKQEIILNPKKNLLEQFHRQQQKNSVHEALNTSILGDRYRFFATISHPYDVDLVIDNPWFKGVIFHPEYLIAAKGSPLTIEEWVHFIRYIDLHCQQRSIIFRLPAFDNYVTTDDFEGEYPTKEKFYQLPLYYRNYLAAIADVMKESLSKISIHVPYVMKQSDVDEWMSSIKFMMKEFRYNNQFEIGFDLVFQSTIDHSKEFRKSKHIVFNLEAIIADYANHFRPYYDHVSLKLFKDSHAHAGIREAIQDYRRHYQPVEYLFIGFCLTNPTFFTGSLRAGYRNFGIHPSFIEDLTPIIDTRVKNKGRNNGVHAFNQARTKFYNELREKLGPDAVIKVGTYKKMLQEKEINIK
ncbi:MAG: hypothetical protein C4537_05925 [Acholeplasma sp.]|jgi:hypothetical protein|nr:MAG: hypothetical protein C4537_05925 [Acholeplasma sp.]